MLALAGLTLVASLGFEHIFASTGFRPAVYGAAIVPAVIFWLANRSGWKPLMSLVISLVALGLYGAWTIAPETTTFGFPGEATWRAITTSIGDSLDTLRTDSPPIPLQDGYLAMAVVATWLSATLALWLAAGADGVLSPLVPPLGLFAYLVAIERPDPEPLVTVAFVAVALVFVALQSTALATANRPILASPNRTAPWVWALRATVPIALIVALLAALAGPLLPGAEAEAFVDFKGGGSDGPRSRTVVSPLVSLRTRLHAEPPIDMFSVTVNEPSRPTYWRLTALDEFDGREFSSKAGAGDADGELASDLGPAVATSLVRQQFEIIGLSGDWIPAAYRPVAIDLDGATFVERTGTLVASEGALGQGRRYEVVSQLPDYTVDELRAASGATGDAAEEFVELPDSVSEAVADLAATVTAGQTTDYDRARALQDHFRDPANYTYDLDAPNGVSEDALEAFLFETKRGYCEQFASAFTVMARSLGLPARIAIGFTPGELDPGTSTYTVNTDKAHAWPEVLFDGYGWVAFEPTPGRGLPSPSDYTGTAATPNLDGEPTPQATTTTVATAPGQTPASATGATTPFTEPAFPGEIEATGGASPTDDEGRSTTSTVVRWAVALLMIAAVVYPIGVVAAKRIRRRRRQGAPATAEAIEGAWNEAVDRLLEAGVAIDPSSTPLETAVDVQGQQPSTIGAPLTELAGWHTQGAYSPVDPSADEVTLAWDAYARVDHALNDGMSWRHIVRRSLDPRPLLRRSTDPDDLLEPVGRASSWPSRR